MTLFNRFIELMLNVIGFVGLVISRLAGIGFKLLSLKTGLSRLLSVNQGAHTQVLGLEMRSPSMATS